MKRSQVNELLRDAAGLFASAGIALPAWAGWSPAQWAARPEAAAYCRRRQIGWDVTDFGSGDFGRRGLVLICLRNGIVGHDEDRSYAEKLLVVREGQEVPYHFHRAKMEDIICRAGGNFQVEVFDTDETGAALDRPVTVRLDAEARKVAARAPIVLPPGQSITLPPGQAHRLSAAAGHGTVVLGEVSRINDDMTDNFFFEPVARLAAIEEDEAPLHPLWSELPA